MDKKSSKQQLLDQDFGAARLNIDFDPAKHGMMPLSLEMLAANEACPADLYLPMYYRDEKKIEMDLACKKGDIFRAAWRDRLIKAEQAQVYVLKSQTPELNEYFDNYAGAMLADPGRPMRKRAKLVQEFAEYNMRSLFDGSNDAHATEQTVSRAQTLVSQLSKNPQVLFNLSAMALGDYSIYAHSANVCMLAMALGRFLGLSAAMVQTLGVGGLLHDVGMAKLKPSVLRSNGPRTPAQDSMFRSHCLEGYKMLMAVSAVSYDALMIVRQHHENADGSGYPEGLKAARTTRAARLVHLVNAYDSLTSPYPWEQRCLSAREAAEYIVQHAAWFGPDLIPDFLRFLADPAMTGGGKSRDSSF